LNQKQIKEKQYTEKVEKFIHDNQFVTINSNPTQQLKKTVKQTLKQWNSIIPREDRWKYTNINPKAPNLHATIKIRKQNTPIRPIIHWKNASAYELAKYLTKTLRNHLHLPYAFNIRNSVHLITDVQGI
jgi:hypothetical protein